jgi:hypothetical protein
MNTVPVVHAATLYRTRLFVTVGVRTRGVALRRVRKGYRRFVLA